MKPTPSAFVEVLESRIAPSVVIAPGGRVAHYTDLDGDRVTVTVSKGRLSAADFVMSSDGATVPGGESLVMLDLSDDSGEFNHANLTIVAKASRLGGDGHANVGFINAGDGLTDLGHVLIDGDLGRIDAGDSNDGPRSPGVKILTAQHFDGADQSVVIGGIAKLLVLGDQTSGGSQNDNHAGGITVSAGNLTLGSGSASQGITISNSVGASIGMGKTGSGSLAYGGSSVFTGSTTVNGGTLQISNPYLGATTINAVRNVSLSNSQVAFNTVNLISGNAVDLVRNATPSLTNLSPTNAVGFSAILSSGGTLTHPAQVSSGTLTLNGSSYLGATSASVVNFANSGSSAVTITSNPTLSTGGLVVSDNTVFLGSASLVTTGSGTLALSGTNTFTGTPPTGGTLLLGGATGLTLNGTTTVSGGNLVINTPSALGTTGNLILRGTGTVTLPTGASINTGTGTLVLGSSNAFTGLTTGGTQLTINGAVLRLNPGGTINGIPNIASIDLANLDPSTAPAGSTRFEIEVGHNDVSITQNRALYESLIASGWVPGTPTFDAAGKLASLKLIKPGQVLATIGGHNLTISAPAS